VTQRAPGVATLAGTVCVSDYDANTYPDCQASNVAEADNDCHTSGCFGDGDDLSNPVGVSSCSAFRVPDGSVAPASFQSDAQDTTFNLSPTYAQSLTAMFFAVPGEHWVGYVSGFKTIDPKNQAADREVGFKPEFALPPQPGGAPLGGPLHWRLVVGFRALDNSGQSADPVDCADPTHFTICADSPPNAAPSFPADLAKPVSDFGVLAGSHVTAGQGATATVGFPVRYLDGGLIGAQQLAITAATSVPGAGAMPTVTTLTAAPNSTNTVNVRVPIPATTPLGSYTGTLSAADGSPAVRRSNTATIAVVDQQAPSIRIGTPAQGATFVRGQVVRADYDCTDQANASGVRSCAGPVAPGAPIDTGSVGTKTFTVNAADNAGNTSTRTTTYTVAPSAAPLISVSFTFRPPRASTTFTALTLKGAPRGSTVIATCVPSKHARCSGKKRFRTRSKGGKVTIKSFLRKRFRAGAEIEVRVTSRAPSAPSG
jgi:hypothetical protein